MFSAKVSGALFDLAIDAKQLDQEHFTEQCVESYGKTNPHETATMMFCASALLLPKQALTLPLSLAEFLFRGGKVIGLWLQQGKVSPHIAEAAIRFSEEAAKVSSNRTS